MPQRRYGVLQFQVDGEVYLASGSFEYNLGGETRESKMGVDGFHGHTITRRQAHIAGEISDDPGLDLKTLSHLRDVTVTLELENGKVIVLPEAVQVAEGTANAQEGNIPVRFEGEEAEEVS